MRKSELEAWVLRVIDQVALGQPNEDARVELKRDWPEPKKAARRIAGHANAAGGDPILWIIGVDQTAGVVGLTDLDVASWFSQVKVEFNELAPDLLLNLNVPAKGKTVVALLFETDRAPFVVKNPAFGSVSGNPVELEVPWREGTGVRSATRSDLLRLLTPLEMLPSFEVREGSLKMTLPEEGAKRPTWWVLLKLYVIPKVVPIVIPFHKCRGTVRINKLGIEASFTDMILYPGNKIFGPPHRRVFASSAMIQESNDELIIDGPGMLKVEATSQPADPLDVPPVEIARVTIEILPANTEKPCIISAHFDYLSFNGKEYEWFLITSNKYPRLR
jgi:hypothetical protein